MQVLTFLHANICANLCEINLRTTVQYCPTAPYDRSLESPLHMNRREPPSVYNLIMSSCKESLDMRYAVHALQLSATHCRWKSQPLMNMLNRVASQLQGFDVWYVWTLLLSWLKICLSNPEWNSILKESIDETGGWNLILNCKIKPSKLSVPPFYKAIIKYFQEMIFSVKHADRILWNNPCVTINSKTLFWNHRRPEGGATWGSCPPPWNLKMMTSYAVPVENTQNLV